MSFLASLLFSSLGLLSYLNDACRLNKIEAHNLIKYSNLREFRKFKKLLRNGSSQHLATFVWRVDWKHCESSTRPTIFVKTWMILPSERFPGLSKFMIARLREHELEHKKNLLEALPKIERVLLASCWLPKKLVNKSIFQTLSSVRSSDILLDILTNHGKKPKELSAYCRNKPVKIPLND